jgi:hypothetical protein
VGNAWSIGAALEFVPLKTAATRPHALILRNFDEDRCSWPDARVLDSRG